MNYQTQQLTDMVNAMMPLFIFGLTLQVPRVMCQLTKTEIKYINRVQELENSYGRWQVRRAESVCPKHDLECIEREASRLAALLRARYA